MKNKLLLLALLLFIFKTDAQTSVLAIAEDYLEKGLTFRQLTNKEIHWNTWGSLGLNLIAGVLLDKKATSKEYMYLPDYVYSSFKNATVFIENQPTELIKREDFLLKFDEKKPKVAILNPLLILSLITFLGIFITYKDYKKGIRTRFLDFILFFISGLIGCILIFLWFFSTHSTAPNNFNFLWAFAPNLVIAFLLLKTDPPKWIRKYIFLLIFFMSFIPILWIVEIQEFPLSVTPLIILIFLRILFLSMLYFINEPLLYLTFIVNRFLLPSTLNLISLV
mgnify:CR=1 FL=1